MRVLVGAVVVLGCGRSSSKPVTKPADVPTAQPTETGIAQAWGVERVSLGPVFEDLTIGGPAPPADALGEWSADRAGLYLHADMADGRITRLEANAGAGAPPDRVPALCKPLVDLRSRWSGGVPVKSGLDDHLVWADDTRHLRAIASFSDTGCGIAFEIYVPVDTFIAKDPSSIVPLDLIGKPADYAKQHYGADYTGTWRPAGLGPTGLTSTTIAAIAENGTIVGLRASGIVDATTFAALKDRVAAVLGPLSEIKGLEGRGYRGQGPPAIRLVQPDPVTFDLYLGGRPTPRGHGTWREADGVWTYHYDNGDEINYGEAAECTFVAKADDTNPYEVLCPPLTPDVVPRKR
jgi:hypothetical protein